MPPFFAATGPAPPPPPAAPPRASGGPFLWGPVCWRFLHVMAENVDEWTYATDAGFRSEVLWAVEQTCACLPCADCSGHATAWLGRALRGRGGGPPLDRASLRLLLCALHNSVNERLARPAFSPEWLATTYGEPGLANSFTAAADRWLRIMERTRALNAAAPSFPMQRAALAKQMREWILARAALFRQPAAGTTGAAAKEGGGGNDTDGGDHLS